MVVEYIRYNVRSSRAGALELAYRRAVTALERSEHCGRFELSRRSEDPAHHVLRIEWDSDGGHLPRFRQSPEFRRFFEALAPVLLDIEEIGDYQVTLSSADRS